VVIRSRSVVAFCYPACPGGVEESPPGSATDSMGWGAMGLTNRIALDAP
jgi:hypothetical protein